MLSNDLPMLPLMTSESGGERSVSIVALGQVSPCSPFRFLRLWIAVLVIYPTNQAVIALTFSNYVLQPLFPTCFPPESGLRILAAICLCKCHLGLACRAASFSLPGGLPCLCSSSYPSFFPALFYFSPITFLSPTCVLWMNGFCIRLPGIKKKKKLM